MNNIPTQHNSANAGDFAETVIMPGDPLRAKYIADHYLTDVRQINTLRCMFAYTGMYQGHPVSVMAHGMGAPSMALYAHELYEFYKVKNIIRIGTAGGLAPQVKLGDVVVAMGACYNTSYVDQFNLAGTYSAIASYPLLHRIICQAERTGIRHHVGNILSSDIYYHQDSQHDANWLRLGILAVEMETASLYIEAARTGNNAAALMTITGHIARNEYFDPSESLSVFDNMIKLALESI